MNNKPKLQKCPECNSTRYRQHGTISRCDKCDYENDSAVNPTMLEYKTYRLKEKTI